MKRGTAIMTILVAIGALWLFLGLAFYFKSWIWCIPMLLAFGAIAIIENKYLKCPHCKENLGKLLMRPGPDVTHCPFCGTELEEENTDKNEEEAS